MSLDGPGKALCVLITESDRTNEGALYTEIVAKAHDQGLSGASVFKGMLGFGVNDRFHNADIEVLSLDLPLSVLIVDTEDKINEFIPIVDAMIGEGLIQTWAVNIELYRHSEELQS